MNFRRNKSQNLHSLFSKYSPMREPRAQSSSDLGGSIYNHESQQDNVLDQEYESKIRPYIDLIDSLRAQGVEQDLALPTIAVIGDQSSGKSSVLEALSGVSLPRGSGMVTQCPLELRLRKARLNSEWMGTISYQGQTNKLQHPSQVENAVKNAQRRIVVSENGISSEIITLEVVSPKVPNLTLIDLPGMIRVSLPNQPENIGEQIKKIIKRYITREETIILVVVPSNTDIATTEALSLARDVDPKGERTLGILTKPDLVDKGTEMNVIKVVRNEVYPLNKGYMIVKCRSQSEIDIKISSNEKAFFENNIHFRCLLEEGYATIPQVAKRLTTELVQHIHKNLSNVETQVNDKLEEAQAKLKMMNADMPDTDEDKLKFLLTIIQKFTDAIGEVTTGEENVDNGSVKLFYQVRTGFNEWESNMRQSIDKTSNELQLNPDIYEKMIRGREFREFPNYKEFENIARKHLQPLVALAIKQLNDITDNVKTCVDDIATKHFSRYIKLSRYAKDIIENICKEQSKQCEEAISVQFKIEELIYCQDKLHDRALGKVRNHKNDGPMATPSQNELYPQHIAAYFKTVTKRLCNQIPLLILYYILHNFAQKLHNNMMFLWNGDKNKNMLEETSEMKRERGLLKDRISRLRDAKEKLLKFPN